MMKKLKILQVNKYYYPCTGGIERTVQKIAEGLQDRTDMKVLVCNDKNKSESECINGVEVHRAGCIFKICSMPISITIFHEFRKLMKDRDIIHFHMPFPLGDLVCLLSGYKGKVIVWWHSDIVRQKKLMLLYKPIMKRFLNRADVIVVATQGHIDGSSYLKPYEKKCVIIPFGVDPGIERAADQWWYGKIHKSDKFKQKTNFLFVGRLVYYKGCEVLLQAYKSVKNSTLTIVGDGPLYESMRRIIAIEKLEHVIIIRNANDVQLIEEFKKCDVLVLPSTQRSEAFGLVQIEAMIFGKPVINTFLPSGVPYVSLDRKTGLTVPPQDAYRLYEAMQWFADHPEERKQLGDSARLRAKNEFGMELMLSRIMSLYENELKES